MNKIYIAIIFGIIGFFPSFARAEISGPGSGLVAHFQLDEAAGTLASDSSGTGNNGTLINGASWSTGQIGPSSVRLQSSLSQKVTVPDSQSLSFGDQDFTVTAWVYRTSSNSLLAIMSKDSGSIGYSLVILNNKPTFQVRNSGIDGPSTVVFADAYGTLPINTWAQITAWHDSVANTINISVNNGPVNSKAYSAGTADTSAAFNIGQYSNIATYWDGSIDDVRVYNRILTPLERTEVYNWAGEGTLPPDTIAPVISNILVSNLTDSSANIAWTTDEASDSQVEFFSPCPLGGCLTPVINASSTAHTVSVSGLSPATTYSYSVRSKDPAGNLATSTPKLVTTLIVPASSFNETVYAEGFGVYQITSMEFAPDGRLFITEKGGQLKVFKNGSLLPTPFLSVTVNQDFENGLLGIAFDPNFSVNRYVYVYYTNQTPKEHRLSRFTASESNPDIAEPGSEVILFSGASVLADYHNAGSLRFGPDGKLYLSLGDNGSSQNAQLLSSVSGKILRLNPDGTIPSDNPFISTAGARGEVWALGLRNPFTFAFDPVSGKMHINDVGQSNFEEVNLGQAGANYGWPSCEGPCSNPNFVQPIHAYDHASFGLGAAITGGTFYRHSQFPSAFQGLYFFGDYVNNFINYITLNNQAVPWRTSASPVDIDIGPDGSLYYADILGGKIYKVSYSGQTINHVPIAVITANPVSGPAPLNVSFSGSSSSDPDNDALIFSWNFGDGNSASGMAVSNIYQNPGSYLATLNVNDGNGGSATTTQVISVGTLPAPVIIEPASGALYSAGDTISYSGSATDAEDGQLPASAFSWSVVFHHNTHTHPFLGPINGVTSSNFTIPVLGETADDVWYRVHLTVTDSTGLTSSVFRDINPRKANITLNSNIPGLTLTLDGQPQTLPYSTLSVVGIERTLGAPSPQTLSGQTYNFVSWSDGGAQSHTISSPVSDTTYTATFAQATSTLSNGLLAHFKFDETSGTVASDSSGNGNIGTLVNGPAWTVGKVGGALNFDGIDDYVNAGSASSLDNVSSTTITAWVYTRTAGEGGHGRIVAKDNSTSINHTNGWTLAAINGSGLTNGFRFGADYSASDLRRATAQNSLKFNEWQHVTVTWDGSATGTNVRIYLNGVEASYFVAMNGSGTKISDAVQNLLIGNNPSGTNTFDGLIDEVRVYSRVLTPGEITELYNFAG